MNSDSVNCEGLWPTSSSFNLWLLRDIPAIFVLLLSISTSWDSLSIVTKWSFTQRGWCHLFYKIYLIAKADFRYETCCQGHEYWLENYLSWVCDCVCVDMNHHYLPCQPIHFLNLCLWADLTFEHLDWLFLSSKGMTNGVRALIWKNYQLSLKTYFAVKVHSINLSGR